MIRITAAGVLGVPEELRGGRAADDDEEPILASATFMLTGIHFGAAIGQGGSLQER